MEIHELNKFSGTLGAGDFLAIDNGVDTSKMAASDFIEAVADVVSYEQTAEVVAAWLEEHPEATTTVQDGSLTEAKFTDALKLKTIKDYVTPEMYGAVGDGITDDTEAIELCCSAGEYVLMETGAEYLVSSTIYISSGTTVNLNGATLKSTHRHLFHNFNADDAVTGYEGNGNILIMNGKIVGGCISFAHGENITIENVEFNNCINNHFLEACACNHYLVTNCTFKGMGNTYTPGEFINLDPCYSSNFPWFDEGSTSYDGTPNMNITVDKCSFSMGEGAYAYGSFAFGVHSNGTSGLQNHKNIKFINNYVDNLTDYAVRLNCMDDVTVMGNVFKQQSYAIQIGSWEVCNNVAILNNLFINTDTAVQGYYCLIRDVGVDGLAIYGNAYKAVSNSARHYKYNYDIDANTVFNVIEIDKDLVADIASVKPPITSFNRIEIHVGAPASGTYQSFVVASFYSRNFQVGESFPVLINENGTPTYGSITITDAHTISTTMENVRAVYLYKENTIK